MARKPKKILCPAGQWTQILFSFAVGWGKDWWVTFVSTTGEPLIGEALEQKSIWIFPAKPIARPVTDKMLFQRDWINAIYWVKVRPNLDATASILR